MALTAIADSVRTLTCDAMVDAIDGGTGAGKLKMYTAGDTTLLATLTFSDPAFLGASAGVASADTITSDTSADASGTCTVFHITDSADVVLWKGVVGTTTGDIQFNTNVWTAGDAISVTALTHTSPAS